MPDQIYKIGLHSPMGIKTGWAEVCLREGRIMLELLGGENLFSGSFAPAYSFEMTGVLRTAANELPGCLRGTLSDSTLRAVFHTERGDFPIEGVLEGPSAEHQ